MSVNLCLHSGAERVSKTELALVPTPEPTASWLPIPHLRMLESLQNALSEVGLAVALDENHLPDETFALARDGARFFGIMRLESEVSPGVSLVVGCRNAHDKSMTAGICAGSRVFICDNLAFSADIVVWRKHTRNILRDLDNRVLAAAYRLGAFREAEASRINLLQAQSITDRDAHDIVVRSIDRDVIPMCNMRAVLEAWRRPPHPEFEPRTAWSLYNAFTEAAKKRFDSNPADAAVRTMRLTNLFSELAPVFDAEFTAVE